MIEKCLYADKGKCKYGGAVDTDKHAYSMKEVGGEPVYWHYLCYVGSQPEVIYISKDSYDELVSWINNSFDKNNLPDFAKEILKDDQSVS